MKILYILAEMEDFWGSRLPLANAAKEKGCSVFVAAPGAPHDPKMLEHGFTGFELPESKKGFAVGAVIKSIFAIKKLLHEQQPDIVHVITLKYSFITGLAAHNAKKPRFVFTIAGLGYLFSGRQLKPGLMRALVSPFLKYALRHPSAYITFQNSDDMNLLIGKKYVRPERVTLIRGSGVNLDKYNPSHNNEIEPPLVVLPARLIRDKGISVFIDMAKIIEKRQIPARFQLAGGIPAHNPFAIHKDEIAEMIEGSPVEWLGKVSNMPELYSKASMIVYPSWYREGIPRALLEGAAMGKPLVVTDHPGCREAVNNNENGFLVPVRDAEATADAVEKLLKDKTLRRAMGDKSRVLAESEFDVKKIVVQTLTVYGF
jgi:glycosyltransferase involved in cell wall biosynthesis